MVTLLVLAALLAAPSFGGGSVWVSNEDGTVSRIGPRRNKVVKTIRLGGQPNGIAVAFRKVWVADFGRGRLIGINPKRNRVERRISLEADAERLHARTGQAAHEADDDRRVDAPAQKGAERHIADQTRTRWRARG